MVATLRCGPIRRGATSRTVFSDSRPHCAREAIPKPVAAARLSPLRRSAQEETSCSARALRTVAVCLKFYANLSYTTKDDLFMAPTIGVMKCEQHCRVIGDAARSAHQCRLRHRPVALAGLAFLTRPHFRHRGAEIGTIPGFTRKLQRVEHGSRLRITSRRFEDERSHGLLSVTIDVKESGPRHYRGTFASTAPHIRQNLSPTFISRSRQQFHKSH